MIATPHYNLVPKDLGANLRWRKAMLYDAMNDASFASAVKRMCAEDILFYFNGFLWTHDPRPTSGGFANKPFITYSEFQDEAILKYLESLTIGFDIAWPKSRTMGATWMALGVIEHQWHFEDDRNYGLVSRNEDCVDCQGDPMSLMWKLDYFHRNQPNWLLPIGRWLGWKDPGRKLLHLDNADNNSTIDGASTTGNIFRSGRLSGLFMDEISAFEIRDGFNALRSTRDVTPSRMFCSTPQGASDAFFEIVHNTATYIQRLHWSKHPIYNCGLYVCNSDGTVKLLDDFRGVVKIMRKGWKEARSFIYPEEYPFILDTREIELRSPWYDNECSRCATKQEVNQELNIDFLGSAYQFFDDKFVTLYISEYCSPPLLVGDLVFDPITLEPEGFESHVRGRLFLWMNIGGSGSVLTDRSALQGKRFGLGSDVSFGTGASNSATSIVDLGTGEKVGVWKSPDVDPGEFADITIALAKFFNNGMMIWDASGSPGKSFSMRVIEKKYRRIYYRRSEGHMRERISDQPGYFLNPEDKAVLLRDYRSMLESKKYINRSEAGMKETLQFVVQPGGKAEHSAALNTQDPTGAREAHGDEVIADALVSRLLNITPSRLKVEAVKAPWMSPKWRFEQAEEEAALAALENW